MATTRQRLVFIDWIRALGMLYVVAFWHGFEWVRGEPFHVTPPTTFMKYAALGLFVFVSGYLLGERAPSLCRKGLSSFYRTRLLRIWPLYAAALVIFLLLGLVSESVAVKSAIGISLFWGPAPLTLWFVAMLLIFYLLAPFLAAAAKQSGIFFVLLCGLLLVAIAVLKTALPDGDSRIVLYFPSFALGVWWGRQGKKLCLPAAFALIFAGLLFFMAICHVDIRGVNTALYSSFLGCISFGIFAVCQRHEACFADLPLVAAVSFASFAMYLFHRPIIIGMTALYFPASSAAQIAYLWLVVLPVIIAASWLAQFLYDRSVGLVTRGVGRL